MFTQTHKGGTPTQVSHRGQRAGHMTTGLQNKTGSNKEEFHLYSTNW